MNKKRELRILFHKWVERKEKESLKSYPSVYGCSPYYGRNNTNYERDMAINDNIFNGTIYFYELSDLFREPKRFFSISLFEKFLNENGIYLALYEKDIIKNIKWSYITCIRGCKTLIIRQSYGKLVDAFNAACGVALESKSKEENKDASVNKEHSIGYTASKPLKSSPTSSKNVPCVTVNGSPKVLSVAMFTGDGKVSRWFG